MKALAGVAIILGKMLEQPSPTYHRPNFRRVRGELVIGTLCGIAVHTRRHSVLRRDHAEKIGRECSRCAALHKERAA